MTSLQSQQNWQTSYIVELCASDCATQIRAQGDYMVYIAVMWSSESNVAADVQLFILGGHLGNMLSSNSC